MTLDSRNGNEIKQSCSLLGLKKKLMNGRNILGFEIKKVTTYMVESCTDNKGKR